MKTTRIILWALLALVLFITAFMVHLPAGFALKQVERQLPPGLVLSQTQGTIWQGQTQVQWQGHHLGQVSWHIQVFKLLTAKLGAQLQWRLAGESLYADIELGQHQMQLAIPQGQVNLTQAAAPWVNQFFFLRGLQGDVHFREFNAIIDLEQLWPETIAGQLVVTDFKVMDIQIAQLEITPNQAVPGKKIDVVIQAENQGWHLSGQAELNAPNRYQYELKLQADSAQNFPDWADMMMRKTSATQAQAQKQGQW
ncbi:MAG: type II secretion system protein N [Thiomicrospira sp.]|uniref:type II secretion system protein N n=1 Tax=Thiomicrospira sp. TaxID=935 RepID=UPI0019E32BC9|nr:type II secretion system protein N [Thiomicrospira sp.]MBE0494033.1 type II secretion system protein N [Thiomicrospira sp.]